MFDKVLAFLHRDLLEFCSCHFFQVLLLFLKKFSEPLFLDLILHDGEDRFDGVEFWRVAGVQYRLYPEVSELVFGSSARMHAESVHEECDAVEWVLPPQHLEKVLKLVSVDAPVKALDNVHPLGLGDAGDDGQGGLRKLPYVDMQRLVLAAELVRGDDGAGHAHLVDVDDPVAPVLQLL